MHVRMMSLWIENGWRSMHSHLEYWLLIYLIPRCQWKLQHIASNRCMSTDIWFINMLRQQNSIHSGVKCSWADWIIACFMHRLFSVVANTVCNTVLVKKKWLKRRLKVLDIVRSDFIFKLARSVVKVRIKRVKREVKNTKRGIEDKEHSELLNLGCF